ncbi:MAG: AAA family ATPase [Chloroflexi bacterium]|nr:AAA family ATPase [Chloroflexota bacterium]|tara:strand:+ start:19950 stop:20888 length:939 start_codon:yes stop_codon:yes gene_type:complete
MTKKIIDNITNVILGKEHEIQLSIIALLCNGHLLIEDVPGVGKTILARSIAKSTGCKFSRIQFTPDLLPSDVTGVTIYKQQTGDFEFHAGPIVSEIVLADEVNRATPKTQSALLEAMEENQITVDGNTHYLPTPFMVIATQNPIEYEGTFPLPEAQLDRFLIHINLGYPTPAQEINIMDSQQSQHPLESLTAVTTPEEIQELQKFTRNIYVDPLVKQYIVDLVNATRSHENIYLGASPRGSLALMRSAQAYALLEGRDFVQPDDVKILAFPTLGHRIIIDPSAHIRGIDNAQIIDELIGRVRVPGDRARGSN